MVKKVLKIIVFIVIIAAVGAGGYIAYREITRPKPPDVASLRTEMARRGDVLLTVQATGKVSGLTEVSLYLEAGQKVLSVPVKTGDVVSKGDVLIVYDIASERDELLRRERETLLAIDNAELNKMNLLLPAAGNELLQYQSDVEQAEKNVLDAETDILAHQVRIEQQQVKIDEAERTLERNTNLFENGALSQRELEYSQTQLTDQQDIMTNMTIQLETQQRALELRQSNLRNAELRLANVRNRGTDPSIDIKYRQQENAINLSQIELERIRADLDKLTETTISPISGHVVEINVKEGQTAARGSVLLKLEDQYGLLVKADISEYDAPKIDLGFEAAVSTQGLPGESFRAKVEKIASAAIDKDGDDDVVVPMEFTLLDTDHRLMPGYSVDLDIVLKKAENVLYIPSSALFSFNGGQAVYIIRDGEAIPTYVVTGLYSGKTVEITQGLNEGDVVVTDPAALINYVQPAVMF